MKKVTSDKLQATSERATSNVFTCIGKGHGAPAIPATREEWEALRKEPWLAEMCRRIEAGDEQLKHRLPVWTPMCAEFKNNHRAKADAVRPLPRLMLDFDEKGHSREILEKALQLNEQGRWRILLVEESVRRGTHVLIALPEGMTAQEAQERFSADVGFQADPSLKDVSRCIYMVTEGHTLWVSEELWRGPLPGLPQGEGVDSFSGVQELQECRSSDNSSSGVQELKEKSSVSPCLCVQEKNSFSGVQELQECRSSDNSSSGIQELKEKSSVSPCLCVQEKKSASSASSASEKLEYHGLSSSEIVAKYWKLNNDGQPPTQGDRNTKIFDLACSLRHIFNFDRELLNRAIPNYDGFPQEEKMQCIDNALHEPRKYMPLKLTRVLQALKAEHAENPELVQALDTVEQETMQYYAKKLPRKIGLGVDEVRKWLPQELHVQALVSMAPALGALLTRVRLDVHGDVNTLNLQSFVVGEAGSGKSRFARIDAALMKGFYAESTANQRLNEQHRREKERKRNAKEVPVFDMLPERCIPARHSVAQVLDMLNSNGGLHCYTFAEEADIMSGNGRQAFADTSAIRRVAYDASSYAQAYKSDTSSRLTIPKVLWNLTQCGTPDALYRAYRNFTDGELSRVAIARMPDNTFTPLIASRPFGERESGSLELLGKLLPLMEGEVKLAKLEKHVVERIESFRLECLKNFDRVAARTRLRIPVTTMRMVCALTCCRFATRLVEKIDMAKKKPAWADGATSAEEYLKSHPSAVADHLVKMQDEEMMTLYDTLSEYLTDTLLYYFRSRIEQAYESDNYKVDGRTRRGKNDSIYERLPQKFDLRMAASAKGHATADSLIRNMIYQWCKQGLVRNVGSGQYEKC